MVMPTEVLYPNGFEATPPDRKNCRIFVDEDGLLVLDQEPLRRRATDTHPIIWRLSASQPYIFRDNEAIVLSGDPLPSGLDLRVHGEAKKVFICDYTRTGPAVWKYTVTVVHKDTLEPLTTLDPSIHQQ
jgi:uncharacterized protein (DUF2249 family)